jgi:hypothetical protein
VILAVCLQQPPLTPASPLLPLSQKPLSETKWFCYPCVFFFKAVFFVISIFVLVAAYILIAAEMALRFVGNALKYVLNTLIWLCKKGVGVPCCE